MNRKIAITTLTIGIIVFAGIALVLLPPPDSPEDESVGPNETTLPDDVMQESVSIETDASNQLETADSTSSYQDSRVKSEGLPELVSAPKDPSEEVEAWAAGVEKLRELPLHGAAVRRHRASALNPQAIETTQPGDKIRLSLFLNLSYIAQTIQIERTSSNNTLWIGQVVGQDFSSLRLLVTPKGDIDGALITGDGHFRILPIGEGPYHLIYEVDYEVLNAAD